MTLKFVVIAAIVAAVLASFFLYHNREETTQQQSSFLLPQSQILNIRDDYRAGIVLRNGKDLGFRITPPDNAQLCFSYGIPESTSDAGEPYQFRVEEVGYKPRVLFQQQLSPSTRKQDRSWQEVTIDLSRFNGQMIRFCFRSSRPDALAYLSQLKLLNPAYEKERYSVLLITVDTLRRDHLSIYGYRRSTTPNLDALARNSALFKNAYSTAPMTVPSITSLMSSNYFSIHQVPNNHSAFSGNLPTLAEALRSDGYSTAAFVGNAVLRPDRGLNRGFDVYNAHLPGSEINRRLPERDASRLTNAALSWLNNHYRERFFLWLHYQDPHAPYTPPDSIAKMFEPAEPSGITLPVVPLPGDPGGIPQYALLAGIFDPAVYVARYDGEIRYADENIAEVLKFFQQKSLMSHTIMVFTADHGESLGENNRYFAHGHNVTAELSNIPLFLYVPGRLPQIYSQPVQTIDIAPTLLKLLSLRVPISFAGKFLFQADASRKILCEQPNVRWSVIHDRGRYVYERTGEESWTGQLAGGELTEDHHFIQDMIRQNLSNGIVLAFSGQSFDQTKIISSAPFRRCYLFDAEPGDKIQIDASEVTATLQSTGGDVDYVFLEPNPEATITVDSATLYDSSGKTLNSTFAASDISQAKLPSARDFNNPGIVATRFPGKTNNSLKMTPEELEELKSNGYVGQ